MSSQHSISKMTLGTVQLGLNYGVANVSGKPNGEEAFKIIDSARSAGINCFDTAADYGDSEQIIGRYCLSTKIKRQNISIVTKFKLGKISTTDVEKVMMSSVEQSLKNLNTDYIDFLLIHDAKEFAFFGNQITKVFEKLLKEGVIKVAGASCNRYSELDGILGNDLYQSFQLPVNILDQRLSTMDVARKLHGRVVFARSIFLQGLFLLDPQKLKGNIIESDKYLRAIREISDELNISVKQLAVRYVKSLRFVNSLVIGAEKADQVYENAGLVKQAPFEPEILEMIKEKLNGAPEWLLTPSLWDKQN
jgi:aryl-alcohol dehydrogenase-like predicted oxidoreductase